MYYLLLWSSLKQLSAISKKAIKEVTYHFKFSSDWIKRLGDGTEESHAKAQEAVNDLWVYTDELFSLTENDEILVKKGIGVDTSSLKEAFHQQVNQVLTESTLTLPEIEWFQKGGKQGVHTEHFGHILTEMQYMQRTYPNMTW